MAELTYDEVAAVLKYEPDTGRLFWRARSPEMFADPKTCRWWNSRYAGKEALTARNSHGYHHGRIFLKYYKRSRIVWLMHYESWPSDKIDHLDGDRSHDVFSNLRDVSQAINLRNAKKNSKNTSGYTGVVWSKGTGKWLARVKVRGTTRNLGSFDDIEDAKKARLEGQAGLGFTNRHGV